MKANENGSVKLKKTSALDANDRLLCETTEKFEN